MTHINLHLVGDFAKAVGEHLQLLCPNISLRVSETAGRATVKPLTADGINVLISWRPVPDICAQLDDLSFKCNKPFIPLIIDSTLLCVGPVVIPGCSSCWHCWIARIKQHTHSSREEHATLLEYYQSNSWAGPHGYLRPIAIVGAARLAQLLEEIDSSRCTPGHLWQLDMLTRRVTTSTVVGVHDCPRCGLHRSSSTRTFHDLRSALSYIWRAEDGIAGSRSH
jgi:bacteriocin biosynthesis cyclodehydratase domain-containing protein